MTVGKSEIRDPFAVGRSSLALTENDAGEKNMFFSSF